MKNIIEEFITRTKWKCKRSFDKLYPGEYDNLVERTKFLPDDCRFVERIYCVLNDRTERKICKVCNKKYCKFGDLKMGYKMTCSRGCAAKTDYKISKIKRSMFETYGPDAYVIRSKKSAKTMSNTVIDGKTLHQIRHEKQIITKNLVGDDGLSNAQRSALKAAKTMSTPREDGKTIYEKTGIKNHKERLISKGMEKVGFAVREEDLEKYGNYRAEVDYWTNRNRSILKEKWDGYDYYDGEFIGDNWSLHYNDINYPTVDHKYSVKAGFENNIPPEEIGRLENLCITKRIHNVKKKQKLEEEYHEALICRL